MSEDESLVVRNNVNIEDAIDARKTNQLKSSLGQIAQPKPNKRFLGTRYGQWIHNQGDTTGFGRFLRNLGSEPSLLDSSKVDRSRTRMETFLSNKGYFDAEVGSKVESTGKKLSKVIYNVQLKQQKRFGDLSYATNDDGIDSILMAEKILEKHMKTGQPYDVDGLLKSREEIVTSMQENGYYYFDNRSVNMELDTLTSPGLAHVLVSIDNDLDSLYRNVYTIDEIYISIGHDGQNTNPDTVLYNDKTYFPNNIIKLKPETVDDFIYIEKGSQYKKSDVTKTIDNLYDLAIVDFANVDFVEDDENRSLKAYVSVSTGKQRQLTFEPELSQAQGVSVSATASYKNKNLFKGGELFELQATGGLEAGSNNSLLDTRFLRGNASILFPRIIGMPLKREVLKEKMISPRTDLNAGITFQDIDQLYKYDEYNLSQKWRWKTSPNNQHYLSILDVSIFTPDTSSFAQPFRQLLKEYPSIASAYESRAIVGGNYGYEYISLKRENQRDFFVFRGDIDMAGNVATAVYKLFGGDPNDLARFGRMELNFVQHIGVGNRSELVFRLNPGVAVALGQSDQIPAVEQFTVGGPNSMRAWTQRSLGPGFYDIIADPAINPKPTVLDQRGDLLLEANAEYRFPLFKVFGLDLNGALFTDAGNVWSMDSNDLRPGARASSGLGNIGVASGGGLRLDIQSLFLVRTDIGFRVVDPTNPNLETPFDLNNSAIQFGIGMPF